MAEPTDLPFSPTPPPLAPQRGTRLTGWPLVGARVAVGLAAAAGLIVAIGAMLLFVVLTFTDDTNGIVGGFMFFSTVAFAIAVIWLAFVTALAMKLRLGPTQLDPWR